jgi:hypothetical protein
MWEILYKLCNEMNPGLHEGIIFSTNCSIALLPSYN